MHDRLPSSSIPKRRTGHIRLVALQGTSQLVLLRHLHLHKGDVVIVVDNDEELQPYRARLAGQGNVHFFGLGDGQTAMLLLNDASSESRRCLAKMANMPAAAGMGQVRKFGHAASSKLARSDHFRRFCRQTVSRIDYLAGGNPKHVDVIAFVGLCGGTGSAVLVNIKALVRAILKHLNVTVHTHIQPLGPKTFIGLGERIETNAAASLADIAAFVIDHDIDPRETRSLTCFELPPTGFNQQSRNAYLRIDAQAMAAPELQMQLARTGPNHSPDSRFGNITVRHASYANFIPPGEVAAEVAPAYLRDIEEAQRHVAPNPELIVALNLEQQQSPLSRESVESIIEDGATRDADEIVPALLQPESRLQFEVRVELVNGVQYELTTIASAAAQSPHTLNEVIERLVEQVSLRKVLQRELAILGERLRELDEDAAAAEDQVRSTHAALRNEGTWNWLLTGWTSPERRQAKFTAAVLRLREVSDERHRTLAEFAALELSLAQVSVVIAFRQGRLTAIANVLAQHRPRGQQTQRKPRVLLNPIDEVWHHLDRLDELARNEQIEQLCFGAKGATNEGLAAIIGAEDGQLELIARKIAQAEFAVEGPHWGGVQRVDGGTRYVVLPPVTPDVRRQLPQLVKALDEHVQVYFADHASAGLNAVRFTFYRIRSAAELFPGQLRPALAEAHLSEMAPMYFPAGTACLQKLGIQIDAAGKVTFHRL